MRRHFSTLAALSMMSLGSVIVANAQEIRGRPLPKPAYEGGIVARVPGTINGISGSAGSSSTYTGIGVPTGASALGQNGRANPAVRSDRMTR